LFFSEKYLKLAPRNYSRTNVFYMKKDIHQELIDWLAFKDMSNEEVFRLLSQQPDTKEIKMLIGV